jgi:alanyl-tRNA synthetase
MNVRPLYMDQPNLFRHRAVVTKIGEGEINKKRYKWIQLNETIFHPKGGGQPSDEGTINGIQVACIHKELLDKTRVDQFSILHCFEEGREFPFQLGDEVELVVDEAKRRLYSRMHTAGHVLAEAVEEVFPELQGYQGNHDPKEGYVKFRMLQESPLSKEEIMSKVQPQLQSKLQADLPVSIVRHSSGMRAIQIGKQAMPCGGTHVSHLKEIGDVQITDISINKKDKTVTVKYHLG